MTLFARSLFIFQIEMPQRSEKVKYQAYYLLTHEASGLLSSSKKTRNTYASSPLSGSRMKPVKGGQNIGKRKEKEKERQDPTPVTRKTFKRHGAHRKYFLRIFESECFDMVSFQRAFDTGKAIVRNWENVHVILKIL